jgi:hypothetical protein
MSTCFRAAPAALLLWLAVSLSGQTETSDETAMAPPKPGCDSYSIQTLPREAFGLKQRACYWGSQLFTGSALFGASLFGAIGEARHKPPEWPQGLQGFGEQMGTRYAQSMVKSTATFIASAITREDPRPKPPQFVQQSRDKTGCGPATSVKARIGQSLLRLVWDACDSRPAPGRLIGSFASGFVGLAWAPPSQDKVSSALVNSGTALAGYIGDSLFSEFEYDLFGFVGRMFGTGKPHLPAAPQPAPPVSQPPAPTPTLGSPDAVPSNREPIKGDAP